ncbi:transposase, partial [Enterobacter cloacae complex sp. 2025EL-00057]|uniref:transposase n=1 Tax=Enterobacter cloacae complex sp. 2025EL-00057 TaxID=3415642 RepID=UPI003C76C9E4
MTKTVSTSKKPRKQHSPEFRSEALKLAERIGVTAAAGELSLYESQLYNWRSKQQNQQTYLIISSAITIAGDGTVGVAVSVRKNLKIRISL